MTMRTLRNAALLLMALISTGILRADTYTYRVVDTTQGESFFGITTAGTFVINESDRAFKLGFCGPLTADASCFATFYAGSTSPVYSLTAPLLTYDNGSPCAPSIPGFAVHRGVCNSGHEIFDAEFDGAFGFVKKGVWTGPDPNTDFLEYGSFDGGFINSRGNGVFIDGRNETLDFAEDISTAIPEPISLALVATGGLVFFVLLARSRKSLVLHS